jgi:hypothetical protein
MYTAELVGTYDSGYVMAEESGAIIVTDRMTFMPGVGPDEVIGVGQIDPQDGYMMMLNLTVTGDKLTGTWEERDSDDMIVYGGNIELVLDHDGRLIGVWSMCAPDSSSESETVRGTWNLAKRLGSTVLG